jgi:hypothetical protein
MTSSFSLESSTGAAVTNDVRRTGQIINPTGLIPGGLDYTHLNALRKSVKFNYSWHYSDAIYDFITRFAAENDMDVDKVYREDSAETTFCLIVAKYPNVINDRIEPPSNDEQDRYDFDTLRTHDRYNDKKSLETINYRYNLKGRGGGGEEEDEEEEEEEGKKNKKQRKTNYPLTNDFRPTVNDQIPYFVDAARIINRFYDGIDTDELHIVDKSIFRNIQRDDIARRWVTFIKNDGNIDSFLYVIFKIKFNDLKKIEGITPFKVPTFDGYNNINDYIELYKLVHIETQTHFLRNKIKDTTDLDTQNRIIKKFVEKTNSTNYPTATKPIDMELDVNKFIKSVNLDPTPPIYKYIKLSENPQEIDPNQYVLNWKDYKTVLTAEFYGSVENGYVLLQTMFKDIKGTKLSKSIDEIIRLKLDNLYEALLLSSVYKYKAARRTSGQTMIYSRVNSTSYNVEQVKRNFSIKKYIENY